MRPVQAATPLGASISNSAELSYSEGGNSVSVTSNTVVTRVAFAAGARIDPVQASVTGSPGIWTYIPHRLVNTGNGTDSYSLYASGPDGWGASVMLDANRDGKHDPSENTAITSADNLAAGSSLHILVAANVATGAATGQQGAVVLAMRSKTDTNVRVTATDTVSVVNPGRIAGKVRNPRGVAVGGAQVTATRNGATVASATSGIDGSYEIAGLPAGDYAVRFAGEGLVPLRHSVSLTAEQPTVSLNFAAYRTPGLKRGLSLLTIPFAFASADLAAVTGPPSGASVAAWAPAPTGGRFVEFGKDAQFPAVAPGVGYLWRQPEAGELPVVQPAIDPTNRGAIPLHPGWNLVGCPALDEIAMSSLVIRAGGQSMTLETAASKGLVRSYAWGYDTATSAHVLVHESFAGARRILEPWMAYWIHSSTECELVAQDAPVSMSLAKARQAPVGESWTAQLAATCGQDSDRFKYFGVAADARPGEDPRYSLRTPPSASGQSLDLAFTPAWARAENGRFATDIRQPAAGKIVWDLAVKTNLADTTVTLSWPDLSRVPGKYRVTLVDLASGRRRYMRTTTSYSFTSGPAGGERQFQIEIDPSPFTRLAVSPLAQMPVQGAVSISYTVSQDAAVSAEIRTLTGNVVRRLASGRQVTGGTNLISWDGRDQSGRVVSNGPYLCVITASGSDGQVTKQSRTVLLTR